VQALSLEDALCGEWYVSDTRYGPMVHARLTPGRPNSGRLVSLVRAEARKLAEARGLELLLIDGPPGIGCPVIASVGGADAALVVTEPTPSGRHDLLRALELLRHFGVPAWFCVNRADVYPDGAREIRRAAEEAGARHAGDIRYDPAVTQCQYECQPVVAYGDSPAANDIRSVWNTIKKEL
jgi:MinD superfamily P-loop ATPase